MHRGESPLSGRREDIDRACAARPRIVATFLAVMGVCASSWGCANEVSPAKDDVDSATQGSCARFTIGGASLQLDRGEGPTPALPPPVDQPFDVEIEGVVQPMSLGSSLRGIVIDTCPPNADCVASPSTLTVVAPILPATLVPAGAFVRLHYTVVTTVAPGFGASPNGTGSYVLIENLPTWGGVPNPVEGNQRIWFAGFTFDGAGELPAALESAPYLLDDAGACDHLGTSIHSTGLTMPGASRVVIPLGEQRSFDVAGERAGHYLFQSLTNVTAPDGRSNLEYWLSGS